jgi:hypothetical protein
MAYQVQTDDIEISGKENFSVELDCQEPVKFIFSLVELKQMRDIFFVKRDFITVGYRAACPCLTAAMCNKSIFMLHNETMNIWSHMLPAFYFIYQLVCITFGLSCYS